MEGFMKYFTLGLIVFVGSLGLCSCLPVTYFNRDDLQVDSFVCGKSCSNGTSNCSQDSRDFYRYLSFSDDHNYLYVGAMNHLFKLNASNLECKAQKNLELNASNISVCVIQGKTQNPDCQNHVRNVMEFNGTLRACSTGAYAPKQYTLNRSTLEVLSPKYSQSQILCPFDPFDNATSIKIVEGNPGNESVGYFGTYTDFMKNFPIIYRPEFRSNTTTYGLKVTDTEDVNWLYSPQFVGSFDVDNEVFFFFREKAIEADDWRNKIYSRVAKVCKKDLGGKITRGRKWLSFQKARLNCSLPGSDPYVFDDIYDVYQSGDLFFALFFKQGAGLNASAICVFTKAEIRRVFQAEFQYKDQMGIWKKVPTSLEPNPRTDNCSGHDASVVFNTTTSSYQLMYNSVKAQYHRPIFYQHGIQFLRLVVTDSINGSRNIYAASTDGEIHNIFMKSESSGKLKTVKTSVYSPFAPKRVPVWNLKKHGNSLILGTDFNVTKISLNVCSKIKKVDTCILNTECKWCQAIQCQHKDKQTDKSCFDHNEISTDKHVYKGLTDYLAVPEVTTSSITGLWVSLDINNQLALDSNVEWRHKNQILPDNPSKYAKTADGSLVIKDIQDDDNGHYHAYLDEFLLATVNLQVIQSTDTDELIKKWKQEFIMWSGEFKKWRTCASDYLDTCSSNEP